MAAHAQKPAAGISMLPPTAPTSAPQTVATPAPIAATPLPANSVPRHRAQVTYTGGLLDVRANNSSLNAILRDIARLTGMKITGGVADQRVFGNYGPARPATILATLLDGTGSNMLLRETADRGPAELVLTPRSGSVTPPSPNSGSFDESDAEDQPVAAQSVQRAQPVQQVVNGQQMAPRPATFTNSVTSTGTSAQNAQAQPSTSVPPSIPQPWNNPMGDPRNTTPTASTLPTANSIPLDTVATPSTVTQPVQGIVDSANPPPPGSTTLGSATSVVPSATNSNQGAGSNQGTGRTPEQIYDQLRQLQQQRQQMSNPQQSGASSSTNSNTTTTPQ